MATLSKLQLDRLSEFTANLGLVFFASMITPLFSDGIDKVNLFVLISGVALTLGCLVVSLVLLKGIKE